MTDDVKVKPGAPSREPLLTPSEVAGILRVKRTWVLRRARAGDLPGHKIGRYVRFRRSEFEEWMKTNLEGDLRD